MKVVNFLIFKDFFRFFENFFDFLMKFSGFFRVKNRFFYYKIYFLFFICVQVTCRNLEHLIASRSTIKAVCDVATSGASDRAMNRDC